MQAERSSCMSLLTMHVVTSGQLDDDLVVLVLEANPIHVGSIVVPHLAQLQLHGHLCTNSLTGKLAVCKERGDLKPCVAHHLIADVIIKSSAKVSCHNLSSAAGSKWAPQILGGLDSFFWAHNARSSDLNPTTSGRK